MGEVKEYVRMTLTELQELDRAKTIFLMAVSPIEVHGPHLPLGTDVFVAEEMLRRYQAALAEEYPDYTLVLLPSLYVGSDALPAKGSLSVPAPVMREVLLAYVKGLAAQGFATLSGRQSRQSQAQLGMGGRPQGMEEIPLYLVNPST